MSIQKILEKAVAQGASDIFIVANRAITFKIEGKFIDVSDDVIKPDDTDGIINELYDLAQGRDKKPRSKSILDEMGEDDFSCSIQGKGRFRANVFLQRGTLGAVIRVINFDMPNPDDLAIPETVMQLADNTNGLVLVTGPAGSGKSTTLACIIDRINRSRQGNIITMEDPIEFIHQHNKSIVIQREVQSDSKSYASALRAALRQTPNVLLLGEMRDLSSIENAMTAAETGQLIFSTLHTMGAANTINRIIDVFPPNQQQQIRVQLSMTLKAVVSQQLLPTKNGNLVPAFEIMLSNLAIQNLIREGRTVQIDNAIFTGTNEGMVTMDSSLLKLYEQGLITKQQAIIHANNHEAMKQRVG